MSQLSGWPRFSAIIDFTSVFVPMQDPCNLQQLFYFTVLFICLFDTLGDKKPDLGKRIKKKNGKYMI